MSGAVMGMLCLTDEAPRARPGDVHVGRVIWTGATGEYVFEAPGSSTIGGPCGLVDVFRALARHGLTTDHWSSDGRTLEADTFRAPVPDWMTR